MDVFLRYGPERPDAIVSMTGIVYVSAGNFLDLAGAFVDEITLTHIPSDQPEWPEGLPPLGPRSPAGPGETAWLSLVGPMYIQVVARTVSVALSQVPEN
ncbi:hypothetical protein ACFVYP_17175 [Kitasatospora sp. NPDC058201]|uniref:hypothetical protein n=1 Tax=Streptomycetaceae TaxID=2062 RepID=UPI002E7A4299|nr:hypothetical protein [Streptomyces sp. BE303]MED7955314.1 hypothetical protein [Streptomyces sp. BE303]